MAARGAWALNEKGLIPLAGLESSVARMREVLRLERPQELQFDKVVRVQE